MTVIHKWRIVKTTERWWTVISPRGRVHGYNTWQDAIKAVDKANRIWPSGSRSRIVEVCGPYESPERFKEN